VIYVPTEQRECATGPDRYSIISIAVRPYDEWTSQFLYHPYLPLPQDESGGRPWGLEQPDDLNCRTIRSTNKVIAAHQDWRDIDPFQGWAQAFQRESANPAASANGG
jgi:hypothetical protein